MHEVTAGREGRITGRAGEGRRARSDELADRQPGLDKGMGDPHQHIVAGVGEAGALGHGMFRQMPVVIMQPAEFDALIEGRPADGNRVIEPVLLEPRPVHPGVDVEKHSDLAAGVGGELLFGLDQGRDARLGIRLRKRAQTPRASPNQREGQANVLRPDAHQGDQLEAGRALELAHAAGHILGHHRPELGGLDVRAETVDIAAHQAQGGADIVVDIVGVDRQRGRHHLIDAVDAVVVKRKLAQRIGRVGHFGSSVHSQI